MTSAPDHHLQVEAVPVGDLLPYPGNARRGDVSAVKESLQVNGLFRPLVVRRETMHVLAGNHTLEALSELAQEDDRWAEVPVTFLHGLTDEQAARIVLADNRTSDLATYDDQALLDLLRELGDDLAGTGYAQDDLAVLESLLAESEEPPPPALADPDVVPAPPADPITRPGDVWQMGRHRIICGDSSDPLVLARLLGDVQVQVAFTSPHYASQRKYDESSGFQPIHPDVFTDWFEPIQDNVRRHLAADGSWFVNIKAHAEDGQRHLYVNDLVAAHVRQWGWLFVDDFCWVDTKNGVPGGWPNRFKDAHEPVFHFAQQATIKFRPLANGTQSSAIFDYSPDTATTGSGSGLLGEKATEERDGLARPSNVLHIAAAGDGTHSAQFPVALPAWFIRAFSDDDDPVLDVFMGSGTTLLAAHNENRVAYGVELSPAYCDVICRRFENYTGIVPVLHRGDEQPTDVSFLQKASA